MKTAFKHSGVEWLGEIPQHWEVLPLRAIYQEFDKRCGGANFELLSVTIEKGIIKQNESEAKKDISNDDKSKYKIVQLNAVAYNKMRMWQGAVGMNETCEGIVSPAYFVLRPKQNFCEKFMAYLLKANFMLLAYNKFSYGICQDQNTLRIEDFYNIKIPLPPMDEQRKIAGFLDEKCGKIAEFIAKKQALIALLKERKKSLINEAVCGRLNLNSAAPREFKRSGVEWLGEIPQHWEVVSLNKLGESFGGLTYTPENVSANLEGTPVLRSNNIKDGKINYENCVYVKDISIPKRCSTKKDDLLICANNGSANLVGKTALVDKENLAFGAFMMVYRSKYNKFIYYILQTDFLRNSIYGFSSATGINQITKSDISTFKIPLPPLNEQQKIAEFLDEKCAEIDRACAMIQAQIEAMREYKSSLIDSAVRGKFEFERTNDEV